MCFYEESEKKIQKSAAARAYLVLCHRFGAARFAAASLRYAAEMYASSVREYAKALPTTNRRYNYIVTVLGTKALLLVKSSISQKLQLIPDVSTFFR